MSNSRATTRTLRSRILVAVVLGILIVGTLYYLYPLNVPYRLGTYTKYEVTSSLTVNPGQPGRVVMYFHEGDRPYATVDTASYSYTSGGVVTMEELEHREGSGIAYTLRAIAWNNTGVARTYVVKRTVVSCSIAYNLWGLENVPPGISTYLSSNEFYPSDNARIRELANLKAAGAISSLDKARRLFDYVTDTIQYNPDYLDVVDVFRILEERQAVCEGYSFVYATLLRSVGIPAFVEIGYSYRIKDNAGGGHAWVEAWLYNQWVTFDPTWQRFAGWEDNGHLLGELAAYDSDSEASSVDWGEVRVLESGRVSFQEGDARFGIMSFIALGGYVVLVYYSLRTQIMRRRPEPSIPPQQGPYKYCPHCGSLIPSDSIHCTNCGRRTGSEGD